MANTYTQIYIHAVFAVKYRQALLKKEIRSRLNLYIYGIIKAENQYPLIINGVSDHIHLFFRIKPNMSVSDLMRVVKSNSSRWLNQQKVIQQPFSWQRGFGAFAVEPSRVDQLIRYIENQEVHHGEVSFKEEYLDLLHTYDIQYEEEHLFDWILD